MATTREQLQQITGNLDESLGIRHSPVRSLPVPKAEARDLGRVPFRNAGRIPTDHIIPDPNQPRKEFDDESLQQLGQSLDSTGQLNPIRVRWSDDHQKWLIVCGERRWRAARLAGRHEIDCLFIEGELPAGEILQQQLIENCQREDLQPMELAHGFADLMTLNDWNAKQVADSMHVPASKVTRILALRKLPSEVQQQVADRHIPERTAYELSKLTCENHSTTRTAGRPRPAHDSPGTENRDSTSETSEPQGPIFSADVSDGIRLEDRRHVQQPDDLPGT